MFVGAYLPPSPLSETKRHKVVRSGGRWGRWVLKNLGEEKRGAVEIGEIGNIAHALLRFIFGYGKV